MASSGTYLWSPELAECVDEAFERCRIDPATLDVSHILSARRSINLLLVEWAVDDNQDFRVDRFDVPCVEDQQAYVIDPDTDGRIIDITGMVLRRSGIDTPILPMARDEWLALPNKETVGRPSRYYADKRQTEIIVHLWPVPENSTDELILDAMRRYQDAGGIGNDPDIPYYMREAFVSGLAAKLAEKFAPLQLVDRMEAKAMYAFRKANGATKDQTDVFVGPGAGRGPRRRIR
jgi:hypothetical protein